MTLKELAKIIGVSVSTVSKALNNSPEISEKTIVKVKELAALHNYQPNRVALNLKSGKTNTIAVLIPSIQNNFFAEVLRGIEEIIDQSNYNLIISITNESNTKEASSITSLANGVVDGFIVAAAEETQITKNIDHYHKALKSNKVIVMFDRVIKDLNVDKVIVNDKEAVQNLTLELMSKGKKTIALVSSIHNLSVGKSRKSGYLEALESNNTNFIIEALVEDLDRKIEYLLTTTQIDAIIALDEDASLSAIKIAKKTNYKVPEQLSIVGYAGEKLAENTNPNLTTINQHGAEIGRQAAKLLLSKLVDKNKTPEKTVIKSTIDNRGTY